MIRRGSIHLVDLEPVVGSEANKSRPAVIVSNDAANATADRLGRGVVTVVPLTTSVQRVYPFQVFLTSGESGLDHDSKAQAEQVRSIDVRRVGDRVGAVASPGMAELDDALRLHLSL